MHSRAQLEMAPESRGVMADFRFPSDWIKQYLETWKAVILRVSVRKFSMRSAHESE